MKLLGVHIDRFTLTWNSQIDSIEHRVSQRIALLKRNKKYIPHSERLLFYNTLIKPLFEYCAHVWGGCSKEAKYRLLKLQKRDARTISDAARDAPSDLINEMCNFLSGARMFKILIG